MDDLARHLTGFLEEVERARRPRSACAMRMGDSKAGRRALGAAAATGVRHMAHRFIVGETPTAALGVLRDLWKDGVASTSTCSARRPSPQPRRSATPTAAPTRSTRCVDAAGGWPARPAARGRHRRPAAAREPVREGLRAHAAAAPGRAGARQARRRRPPAPAAAPRERARRAPAHRHGVDGLARRGARADPRRCWPRTSSAPARAPGWCCRPTCATRRRRWTRSSSGCTGRRRPRAPADHPARQGRLLGPRDRPGRASTAGRRRYSSVKADCDRTSRR